MTTHTGPSGQHLSPAVGVPSGAWAEAVWPPLHLLISPEEDGTVSVVVLNLPGAGSCGETEEEGIRNALEAVAGVAEEYAAEGRAIPWRDSTHDPIPSGSKVRWVAAHG